MEAGNFEFQSAQGTDVQFTENVQDFTTDEENQTEDEKQRIDMMMAVFSNELVSLSFIYFV